MNFERIKEEKFLKTIQTLGHREGKGLVGCEQRPWARLLLSGGGRAAACWGSTTGHPEQTVQPAQVHSTAPCCPTLKK